MSRIRRLLEWCGFTHETWNTPIHQRLSNVVPTKAERELLAERQAETALMLSTEPYGLSVMEEQLLDGSYYVPWPGIEEAMRRAGAEGATGAELAYSVEAQRRENFRKMFS